MNRKMFLGFTLIFLELLAVRLPDLYAEAPAKVDLEKSVTQLFTQIVHQSQTKKIDFVFLIDLGQSMYDRIQKLLPVIGDLGYICAQANSDCRFGLVKFWELSGNQKFEVYSTLTSAELIQRNLSASMVKEFKRRGGFGLDAIFKTTVGIPFRADSLKYILLITDQPLRSSQSGSEEKLADEIISNCSRVQIQVNIIGVADSLSFRLTDRTKGGWQPISSEAGVRDKPTISEILGRHLLKIDGIIREVAKHIAESCKPTVDVIFMLDSSVSMSDKADGIIEALPIFAESFEKSRLNYQFGAIRFFAASGGGESRVIVSQPPLSTDEVNKLLRLPKTGDEHLLDAIIEGIPKIRTRQEAKVSLVIFTDEPSTTAQGSDTTDRTSEAMAVCKSRNIQVNIIGASALGAIGSKTHIIGPRSFGAVESKSFATDFQIIAPQATGGIRFAIPGGDTTPSERR